MSRAPLLTRNVIDSLDNILSKFKPADYLGTSKEAGVKYLAALIKHNREPKTLMQRRKVVTDSRAWEAKTRDQKLK